MMKPTLLIASSLLLLSLCFSTTQANNFTLCGSSNYTMDEMMYGNFTGNITGNNYTDCGGNFTMEDGDMMEEGTTLGNKPANTPGQGPPATNPPAPLKEELQVTLLFSFFADPTEEVSESDAKTAVCSAESFLTGVYQTASGNQFVAVSAKDISWSFQPGENFPVTMSFTVDFRGRDNMLIQAMADIGNLGWSDFVTEFIWYVQPLTNIFLYTKDVEYETKTITQTPNNVQVASFDCSGEEEGEEGDLSDYLGGATDLSRNP